MVSCNNSMDTIINTLTVPMSPIQYQRRRIMSSIVTLLPLLLLLWGEGVGSLQIGFFGNRLTESSATTRPSKWRRVLPFGGESSSPAAGQQRLFDQQSSTSSRLSWFSAVPNDALKNSTMSKTSSSSTSSVKKIDTPTALRLEAEEMRRRAREIMAEVQSMEAELKATRSTSKQKREEETAALIDRMFLNRPLTPEAAAQVIKEQRWSAEEAQLVLDGLFTQAYGTIIIKKESSAQEQLTSVTASMPTADTSSSITVVADANASQTSVVTPETAAVKPFNATEALFLEAKMDCLINAAEIIDEIVMVSSNNNNNNKDSSSFSSPRRWSGRVGSMLRARRNELRRAYDQNLARQLVLYEGAAAAVLGINGSSTTGSSTNDLIRRPAGLMEDQGQWPSRTTTAMNVNVSDVMEKVTMAPLWVPSSLLHFLVASPSKIEAADIKTIKEKVLSGTAFFCTSTESVSKAAIFKGNIRGVVSTDRNLTAGILAEIQQRLQEQGLSERLQLFFLQDPEWRQSRDQNKVQAPPKPAILAIPADVVPDQRRIQKKKSFTATAVKVTAATVPILSTLVYSIKCYSLNPKFFDLVMNKRDLVVLTACLPVFLGVFAVQAIHELAHFLVAKKRGIKIGLPFPLPSFQLGMFGCITPIRSFPKDRSALLDFALSGPVSGMLLSIMMMIAGIRLTIRASGADILRFPVMPIALLKSSFLTGSLLTLFAPKAMILPLSQPLPLHPIFMVGYAGLLSSALNLLPIFRLDGGRACSAAMGPRFGAVASSGTLLFMFSTALSSNTGVAFGWVALILLFQRRFEIPVRDEVTEVDDVRLGGWVGSLATAILALAPFPGGQSFL